MFQICDRLWTLARVPEGPLVRYLNSFVNLSTRKESNGLLSVNKFGSSPTSAAGFNTR